MGLRPTSPTTSMRIFNLGLMSWFFLHPMVGVLQPSTALIPLVIPRSNKPDLIMHYSISP
jgi:hypothetical protein